MFNWKNWVKVIWWAVLLAVMFVILCKRVDFIIDGTATNLDIIAILIFIALAVLPIVSEVNILGVKLKQDIANIKESVDRINMNIGQSVVNHNHINSTPPSSAEYPEITKTLEHILNRLDKKQKEENDIFDAASQDNIIAFKVRLSIETELNRLLRKIPDLYTGIRSQPNYSKIKSLAIHEVIDPDIIPIIMDVLAVCNKGVHDTDINSKNIAFISDAGAKIVSYLKSID